MIYVKAGRMLYRGLFASDNIGYGDWMLLSQLRPGNDGDDAQ
jgi:hypothetical protein